jgi:transcriptional regulator with XRE-family HTH domain
MLTASQIRAARAMAAMTVDELAAASGLSVQAINDAEAAQSFAPSEVAERLRVIFESKGVVFLAAGEDDPNIGPGVRLRQHVADEGIRPQNLSAANDG